MKSSCIEEAVGLRLVDRHRIVDAFFSRYPGCGREPFGLGRAIADFVHWQADSGRLADTHGSDWWKAVNGSLVLDLLRAQDALEELAAEASAERPDAVVDPASEGWRAYARQALNEPSDGLQESFWSAHQQSVHRALADAWPLYDREPRFEREFIGVAMEIVDLAAFRLQPTDSATLGRLTYDFYPHAYPAAEPCSQELRTLRDAPLRAHSGPTVGLYSTIWSPAQVSVVA